jgi:all-trans-retinol dehydrogenase (NAD+)
LITELLAKPGFTDPVLEMDEVTREIVKQVLAGRSGQLILPAELNMVSSIRSWPSWMQYAVRNKIAHVLEGPDGWQGMKGSG